jgi:hypothetical protein
LDLRQLCTLPPHGPFFFFFWLLEFLPGAPNVMAFNVGLDLHGFRGIFLEINIELGLFDFSSGIWATAGGIWGHSFPPSLHCLCHVLSFN